MNEAARSLARKVSSGLLGDSLPADWERRTNEEGVTYYVHKLTGIATYERPQPLPADWRMAKDPASGVVYFWNVKTRETRPCDWVAPPPPPPAEERPARASSSSGLDGDAAAAAAERRPPPPPSASNGGLGGGKAAAGKAKSTRAAAEDVVLELTPLGGGKRRGSALTLGGRIGGEV